PEGQENNNPVAITMDDDKTITAVFVRNAPELSVNPTDIEFSFNIGNPGEPFQKDTQITIENTGAAGVLTWNVGEINYQEGTGWITTFMAAPTPSGQLNPGEQTTIGIQVDRTDLAAGIYHATVPIESNAGTENIDVTMSIDTPPTAAVIYPIDEEVKVETFLTFKAQFTDPDEGDEIVESTWEIYPGTFPTGGTPYIFKKILTGNKDTLRIPWSLFNHIIERQGGGNEYWWRVKCKDKFGGLESEWANSDTFTVSTDDTMANQQFDQATENLIKNNFANAGIAVDTAFKDAVNSETIVAGVDTGSLQIRSMDPAEIEGSEAFNIEYLFDIRVDGLTAGETVVVSIFIPGNYTGNWYKYNPVDNTWTIYPNAEIVGTVTVDAQTYTRIDLTLTDGGDGDFDGEANGVIVDPSGFGPITGVSSVSGGGGGCFIATAAYGSYQEKHVWILRQFRDKYLLTNKPGKAFVRWYYKHSPKYASIIAQHPVLRGITRILLTPLYVSAYIVVKNLALPLLLFLLAFGGLVALRRKVKTGKIFLLIFASLFLLFSTSSFAADTNLFKIAPGEKYTVVSPSSETIGKGKLKVDFFYSYADNPVEGKIGGANKDLISEQSLIQIGATYGLTDKFDVSLTVPYLIDQSSDLTTVDDNGFGDVYLSGKYQILNKKNSFLGVAIIPFIGIDTGEENALMSADSTVFGVKFAFDKNLSDNLIFAFNLGYSHQDEEQFAQIDIENAFLFGTSLTYLVNKNLYITGEIYGRSDDGFFDYEEAYPVEGAISIGYQFKNFDFIFGGATSITDGYGTSNYRIFTGLKASL
ncbi:MAG TPA: transporter, partial [bacterium]|nr:transporter [bacterium]